MVSATLYTNVLLPNNHKKNKLVSIFTRYITMFANFKSARISYLSKQELGWLISKNKLVEGCVETPFGAFLFTAAGNTIFELTIRPTPRLADHAFDLEKMSFAACGTPFEHRVWQALRALPRRQTIAYSELSELLGCPQSTRAVAGAVAKNPLAYIIPCHLVICKNGQIGGFRWGPDIKRRLQDFDCE